MFDSHHYHSRGPEMVNVKVSEKRAPTDESVRLLKDIEQAARDKIVQAIRLENSPIDCVVHAQNNHLTDDRDDCVFVKVNGKRIEARKSFSGDSNAEQVARGLLEETAMRIASEILGPAFANLPRHLLG